MAKKMVDLTLTALYADRKMELELVFVEEFNVRKVLLRAVNRGEAVRFQARNKTVDFPAGIKSWKVKVTKKY